MVKDFQERVAVVTGAGQGIGYAICRTLAHRGAKVILNDIESSLARDAARQISMESGFCIAVPGDAADPEFVDHLTSQAIEKFGSLSIAVANAGITLFGDFFEYSVADFNQVLRTNLQGSFFLAQSAARLMRDQQRPGSLLFMSSVTGHQAHKNLSAYGMSKAALEMLARTLVVDLSPYKITVNAVAPGATLNERTQNDPDYKTTWSRITPMGRPATTDDVAEAVAFLVSPAAAHITGQTLVIDGGWSSVSPSPYEESDSARSSEH